MSEQYAVEIIEEGRSGRIRYSEGPLRSHEFYWEFAAGKVVALIYVPTPSEWPALLPWAAQRRAEILDRVITEVCRTHCRGCRPVIVDGWLELLEPDEPASTGCGDAESWS
jgi:hypothetical protein